jgi:hypothetical protein
MSLVEEALHRGFFDGAIHAFDLPIGPWVVRFGKAVFYSVDSAGKVEWMTEEASGWTLTILRKIGELDFVVGEHSVDTVRNGFYECFKKICGRTHICFFDELDDRELRGPVDGHEEIEFALGGPHLRQVDVDEARCSEDRVSWGIVACKA